MPSKPKPNIYGLKRGRKGLMGFPSGLVQQGVAAYRQWCARNESLGIFEPSEDGVWVRDWCQVRQMEEREGWTDELEPVSLYSRTAPTEWPNF